MADTPVDSVPSIVDGLRQTFRSGKTKNREWRMQQLLAFQRMLRENDEMMKSAVKADLNMSEIEAALTQINGILFELDTAIRHFDEWVTPDHKLTNLFNLPGKSSVVPEPLGVVTIFGAWNFSLLLTLQPLVGAIAAGNTAILKPSELSEKTAEVVKFLVEKYLDPEAIVCLHGGVDVATALLNQKVDMIFFTGSTAVGKVVYQAAAKHLTPVVLELGGKNPCVVDQTVDIDVAAARVVWGSLLNCGQLCLRPDYVLVHESVHDKFVAAAKRKLKEFLGANPEESEYYGRIVNKKNYERLMGLVSASRPFISYGGEGSVERRYLEPTILDFGSSREAFEKSACMQDEVFGPLIVIASFSDFDADVVQFISGRPKALTAYLFSNDKKHQAAFVQGVSAGSMLINDVVSHISNENLPFGGVGASGIGCYHGEYSFRAFSHRKPLMIKPCGKMSDPPFRYPPYSDRSKRLLTFLLKPSISHYYSKICKNFTFRKTGCC